MNQYALTPATSDTNLSSFQAHSISDGALSSAFGAPGSGRAGNPRITLSNGEVFINGTHSDNRATIKRLNSKTVRIELIGIDTRDFNIANVDSILFRGRKGDDVLTNSTSIPVKAYGNEGDDILRGGLASDLIFGGAGNDRLYGGDGNDDLRGEFGNDTLYGQNGNDKLSGANGNDFVYGGNGDDMATGDAGDDYVHGGNGNDVVQGWTGDDILIGEDDNDWIVGGDGNDILSGGSGNDQMYGQRGRDELSGGTGSDTVYGGDDRDVLFGSGNDKLDGGGDPDNVYYFESDSPVINKFDIRIRLKNGSSSWNVNELRTVNRGVTKLRDATGTNRLLTDHVVGKDILLEKVRKISGGAAALNKMTISTQNGITKYDRVIKFADWNENNGPINDTRVLALVHEIAHNFDNDFELDANPHVSRTTYKAFTNQSSWRKTKTNSNYVRSQDGMWWYHKSSQFYRSYSTINPAEDWATMWEMFFNEDADRPAPGSKLGKKISKVSSFFSHF